MYGEDELDRGAGEGQVEAVHSPPVRVPGETVDVEVPT